MTLRRFVTGMAFVAATLSGCVSAQTPSTGRLSLRVSDPQGAAVQGAIVTVKSMAGQPSPPTETDNQGEITFLFLVPGVYDVTVGRRDFASTAFRDVRIIAGTTTNLTVVLHLGTQETTLTVTGSASNVQQEAQIAYVQDAETTQALPTGAHNVLQTFTIAPGVDAAVSDGRQPGRNTPNASVNGIPPSHNNLQINGINSNEVESHDLGPVATPAPESCSELSVVTSLPDVSIGGGGAALQLTTASGSSKFHGKAHGYFKNKTFNANDPDLKSAGIPRPAMSRNAYGGTLGGPAGRNRFFFVSYQGTRENNGATDQSLYKNVLIARGLTEDRSDVTLLNIFHPMLPDGTPASAIHPIALRLLNTRLPNGQFLIPTPQQNGRVTGTALSTYREEQFNTNMEFHFGKHDTVTPKFFYANGPQFDALGFEKLPGFGSDLVTNNRVLSITETHLFGEERSVNDFRFGYNYILENEVNHEPLKDTDLGIQRPTAQAFPGLPLIVLGRDEGAAPIGTEGVSLQTTSSTMSLFDSIALTRGKHTVRFGGEMRRQRWYGMANLTSYGEIDFSTFNDFLVGNIEFSLLGLGTNHRDFRSTDYALFLNDEWKIAESLTLNFGMRYELDPPPYEAEGRIGGFDPALYRPNMALDENGFPLAPPAGGFVQPDNVASQFRINGVPLVGRRLLKSNDPNNFGPRVGFVWSPFRAHDSLVLSGGYGLYYSRPSFFYLGLDSIVPPFFTVAAFTGGTFTNPFPNSPPESEFPGIPAGVALNGSFADRNNRTPYVQQFNLSIEHELAKDTALRVSYVGTRGVKLLRGIAVNQARIASTTHPIRNDVTGKLITMNSPANASLRAPMQGVDPAFFVLNRSDGGSTYHSLQAVVNRPAKHGLYFEASYTFSKSIDNSSNAGGGAFTNGTLDTSSGSDLANVFGNQLDPRAGRAVSDFDRRHRFVLSSVWRLPNVSSRRSLLSRALLRDWQASTIVTVTSGVPIDLFDPSGGSFYGLAGARPNWAPGANLHTASTNVPSGYYFNPFAFAEAIVNPGQPVPSAHDPAALAGDAGTDLGNVGRNVLRGPGQSNIDLSIAKHFAIRESGTLEFRVDLFNALNHRNPNNPISDLSVVSGSGGSIDPNTGRLVSPGDFGRIIGSSSAPRIMQLSVKLSF